MSLSVLGLFVNSLRPEPSIAVIFGLVAFSQAVLGFHRPSMEALTQALVTKHDYAAIGALSSFRFSFGAIPGPAFGGMIIGLYGVKMRLRGRFHLLRGRGRMPGPDETHSRS